MSFVAHKTLIINGAAAGVYTIEFPVVGDGNYMGHGRVGHKLYPHMEIANMSGAIVYGAFDRAVIPPVGVGVQGTYPAATYPRTGPFAGTQGDFDFAVSTGNGWGALDISIPPNSMYMTLYVTMAGLITASFGNQM